MSRLRSLLTVWCLPRSIRSSNRAGAVAGLIVATFALLHTCDAVAGPLTSGNLVVVQVGDGSAAGGQGVLLPAVLQEFSTKGTLVQAIPLPTASSGANNALTINRLTDAGGLTRSVDGQYLVVGGTNAAPRTTPANPVGRVIGRVDSAGTVDTSTRFNDAYGNEAGNTRGIRTAVSVNGSAFWTSGDGTGDVGVRYVTYGGSTSTAVSDPTAATRHLTIAGGQLYNSNGTAATVGSGLPTSGPVALTHLDGLPFGPANSPLFLDLDPNIPGVDTLYVGLETTSVLAKYTFDGTLWNAAASYPTSSTLFGLLYLTGQIEEGKVAIYATARTDSSNAAFGNSIVKLVDEENGSFTFSTLAVANSNYTFRGIAFAPVVAVPEPSSYVLAMLGVVGLLAVRRRRAAAK